MSEDEIIALVFYPRVQFIRFRNRMELIRWANMNRDWDIRWREVSPDEIPPDAVM